MKLVAILALVALALFAWAWFRRPAVPEPDDVQPWDWRTVTLASGADWTYTERPN